MKPKNNTSNMAENVPETKIENITEKYALKMKYNQFRKNVNENFMDASEYVMIKKFEEICLILKEQKRNLYSMIELGSNQCYYSMLFKAILGTNTTKNIMIEPFKAHLEIGQEHFDLNEFEGTFIHRSIGKEWRRGKGRDTAPDAKPITIEEIMSENNLDNLTILHSDIDGSENVFLEQEKEFLSKKKIEYIFLLAHGNEKRNNINFCEDKMKSCGYKLIFKSEPFEVGSDTLLLFEA